ncbi:hypothetical protein [Streptococcus uberis]|uniref:hypothetical protein n=1 Tax=Streptococcus uberis TaxID=1349 RepID=UPI0012B5D107|nr:hypothetical protein [Streptococcus uberis]MTC86470.1 hypothetical protein [Streptococcus uberis]
MALEAKHLLHTEDFSNLKLFGEIEKSFDFHTKAHDGYRINVIIMDPSSPIYLRDIQLKVKTTNPSLTNIESYQNKQTDVELIGLNVGIYDRRLIFNCDDVVKKPTTSKG